MSSSANTAKKRSKRPSPPTTPSPLKPQFKSTAKITSSDEESESDGTSSSESSSSTEPTAKIPPRPTTEYRPPPTFTLLPAPAAGSLVKNPFSPKNLVGKELWLVSAPSAAPLSKLRVIYPADIVDGTPVVQTGSGKQYSIQVREEIKDGVRVVLPDGRGGYRLEGEIAKCFQVVETLPAAAVVERGGSAEGKPVRGQPEGLKMRFRPIGYEAVDGKDEEIPEVLEVPEKGVNGITNNGDEGLEPKRKKKKRRSSVDGVDVKREKKHKSKKQKANIGIEA